MDFAGELVISIVGINASQIAGTFTPWAKEDAIKTKAILIGRDFPSKTL
ncbi:hypothetical protein JCM19237_4409 [Photobacterium aphoticum]|uniref:Uncharacterized protein n=1 Tax=Photobacterium aphoticum TaxID=754436 RepID=A0A090QS27_9GAMM|nr:hypothetical protein JCM19237_4409 [Photobacterium aphoticum]